MVKTQHIKFSIIDRLFRFFVGFMLLLFAYALAANSEWFVTLHFAAMYPIFTAMIAWDPVYFVIEIVKQWWVDFWILR